MTLLEIEKMPSLEKHLFYALDSLDYAKNQLDGPCGRWAVEKNIELAKGFIEMALNDDAA